MDRIELACRLAQQARTSMAEAADHVDRVVHDILCKLRAGKAAVLPGLGKFHPGPQPDFEFRKALLTATRKGRR